MGDKRFKNSPAAALITPDGQKVNHQLIFSDISTEYINCSTGQAATRGSKIHFGPCAPITKRGIPARDRQQDRPKTHLG
jgi:hypothetical protein